MPMRNRPGFTPTSCDNGRTNGGAMYGSPDSYPQITSSTAAVSRTVRVTQPSMVAPIHVSPRSGPLLTRPRDGLSPTSPHSLAGTRIEPPPSFACPTDTIWEATLAAEPPLEPPVECSRFHGLRVGPYDKGSVVIVLPNSGVFVRPITTNPARKKRCVR